MKYRIRNIDDFKGFKQVNNIHSIMKEATDKIKSDYNWMFRKALQDKLEEVFEVGFSSMTDVELVEFIENKGIVVVVEGGEVKKMPNTIFVEQKEGYYNTTIIYEPITIKLFKEVTGK